MEVGNFIERRVFVRYLEVNNYGFINDLQDKLYAFFFYFIKVGFVIFLFLERSLCLP